VIPDAPNARPDNKTDNETPTRSLSISSQGETALAEASATTSSVFARKMRSGSVKHMAVMTLSAGIVATLALPAYAFAPNGSYAAAAEPAAEVASLTTVSAQNVIVSADVEAPEATRAEFSATTMEELEEKRAKKRAEKRAQERAEQREREQEAAAAAAASAPAAQSASASAPAPQAVAAAPSANGGSIVSVARQYLGVPYVFGGASPSGFDCSGLTMYVYAQFGISLPHSSAAQGANGTRVSNPVPGDLVIIDGGSHVGIYTGGGNMIDAPMPGRVVNERPIYSANHYFVRY
jgi:cell wall-associated NlpC family hydrolase